MPAQLKSGKWSTVVLNNRRECRKLVDDTNKLLSDVLKAIQSRQASSVSSNERETLTSHLNRMITEND